MRDVAVGAFFFSLMTLGVKLAGARLPSQEIVLVRGVISLLLTWAMLRRAGVTARTERPWMMMLRGLFGFGALSCVYYAAVNLPLAEATVFQYMNPIWTALLAAWLLGERMRPREAGLVLAALLGVVIIARPSFLFARGASELDLFAVAVALTGSMCSGAAYVTVRQLGRTEHALTIVFWFTLVTVPAAIPGTLAGALWPTPREWLLMLFVGATAQGGQVFLTRGLQREAAGRATAAGYTQIVFAALWGALFFGDFPDLWVWAGAAIILTSTIVLARAHRRVVPSAPVADEGANVEGVETEAR